MKMKMLLATVMAVLGSTVQAQSVIGTYTFEDNAFADTVGNFVGTGALIGTLTEVSYGSVGSTITDTSIGTYVSTSPYTGYDDISFDLGFTDNQVFNGDGTDLVLFYLWDQSANDLNVTINGTSSSLSTGYVYDGGGVQQQFLSAVNPKTGAYQDAWIQAAEVDLSDFGLAYGAELTSAVTVNLHQLTSQGNTAVLSLVGATYTTAPTPVPVPAAVWLFGSGLLGLVGVARRRT